MGELYNTVKEMNQTIINFLKEAGVSDAEITTNAPSILDTRTNLLPPIVIQRGFSDEESR